MASTAGHASCMGTTIGGYEVLSHIGRGAMGTVYLARDAKLGRYAALKVLLGSVARNPGAVKRFHLEAQAAAPLRHPNIVRIYSAGVDEGIPYIAMEYVEGEPLDRFLRRKGQLKWQNALYIAQQVAEALDCAHCSNVVHRDIKPANIMLDRQGRVRLTDFGIADVNVGDGDIPEDTGTMATPQYMSPEQCCGRPLTPACDLFALGVTLYQMITGDFPFKGESAPALVKSITNDEPPRVNRLVPDVPDDVARLVAYLLEKRPENRPDGAHAVSQLIQRVQHESGGTSAMPAALTAFIKEQTQPRAFGAAAQAPGSKRPSTIQKKTAKPKRAVKAGPSAWRTAMGVVAVLALATGIATALMYGIATRGAARPNSAPPVDAMHFTLQHGGALVASLSGDAYQFQALSWVGERPALLVEVCGRPGTLMQGVSGVLAVEPDASRALSVVAPQATGADRADAQGTITRQASYCVTPVAKDSPFFESVIVQCRQSAGELGGRYSISLAQRWNEAGPRPDVLYRVAPGAMLSPVHDPWGMTGALRVAVSPDGGTLCLVVEEPGVGTAYLVERDVHAKPLDRLGARLTTSARILPQSVRYSPDGSQVIYIRERPQGERELWTVASGGRAIDGQCLLVGALGESACFDPAGGRVAINRYSGGGDPSICVVDCATKAIQQAGYGYVGPESWTSSGERLMVAARAGSDPVSGPLQMYSIGAVPPFDVQLVGEVPGGIRPPVAASRDGRWVAAVADVAVPPALVFVELQPRPATRPDRGANR